MFCLLVWVVYSTSRLNSSDVLFLFCVSGSSEWQSVCASAYIPVCVCMCQHEAPVNLQMAEPAGTTAVLRSVGAGI